MRTGDMARYWDRRAREDPFHYVDNREPLRSPDVAAFWQGGEEVIDQLFAELGLELSGDEDVVDIGCGIGRLTRALAHRVRSVHALDVSQEMLTRAREYNDDLANVTWIHGDGTTLAPLPAGSFHGCVSFVVFQHLPDPELTYGYLREMGRVLRPGGWGAFQVSNDVTVHDRGSASRRLGRLVRATLGRGPRTEHPAWRGSAVDMSALRAACAEGRLDIERISNEGTQFCHVLVRRRQ